VQSKGPEPRKWRPATRELHSIGLEGHDGRGEVFVLPPGRGQRPPTWVYAGIEPEPVGSLFLSFRFAKPRPIRARVYAFGLWAILTRRYRRPLWLRYRGDHDTHPLAPGSIIRLWFREGLIEIAPPGRVERVSI
jgi:hypothetical protein